MNDCERDYSNGRDYSDDSSNDSSLRQSWCSPLCLIEALPFHDLGDLQHTDVFNLTLILQRVPHF